MRPPRKQTGGSRPAASREAGGRRDAHGAPEARDASTGHWLADAALVLAIVLTYLPVLKAGFIWDDDAHVTRPDLQSLSGLRRIWFEPGATQQYYPVLHSAFWVEHRLWGQAPLGYHLLNVGLHAAAALLLARLVLRLVDPAWPPGLRLGSAYLAAALFALHPVEVETVAWIAEEKNTLSLVCALAAALSYLRFDRQRTPGWYAAATGWFLAALLSKSVTATLPAALAVVLWWRRGRLEPRRDWGLAPWLGFSVVMGAVTAGLERTQIGAQGPDFALSFVQRALLAGRIAWFYLGHLLWPAHLTFIYPRWSVDPHAPSQWLGLVAALALLAVAYSLRRRMRGPLALVLLFGGLLFPALGFVNVYPFLFSYVADHFQYLASAAFCAAAAIGYAEAWKRGGFASARAVAIGLPALLLLGLASLTHALSATYQDSETLYRTTLSRNPQAWLAQLNLGAMLLERGQGEEAKALLLAAEKARPDYPLTHFDLGQLLLQQGDMPGAAAQFQSSLALRPLDAEACNNLGIALASMGQRPAAEAQFAAALRLRPRYPRAHCNWAVALMQEGRWAEARLHLEAALDEEPGNAEALALQRQLPSP